MRPGGGGMGGGMDPEEMRRAMEETRRIAGTAARLDLTLSPETTELAQDSTPPLSLELEAEPTSVFDGMGEIQASAKWTRKGLKIEREIPNGGEVVDTYTLEEGGRLILRREVRMLRGRTEVRVKTVYRKEGSGGT